MMIKIGRGVKSSLFFLTSSFRLSVFLNNYSLTNHLVIQSFTIYSQKLSTKSAESSKL